MGEKRLGRCLGALLLLGLAAIANRAGAADLPCGPDALAAAPGEPKGRAPSGLGVTLPGPAAILPGRGPPRTQLQAP